MEERRGGGSMLRDDFFYAFPLHFVRCDPGTGKVKRNCYPRIHILDKMLRIVITRARD